LVTPRANSRGFAGFYNVLHRVTWFLSDFTPGFTKTLEGFTRILDGFTRSNAVPTRINAQGLQLGRIHFPKKLP